VCHNTCAKNVFWNCFVTPGMQSIGPAEINAKVLIERWRKEYNTLRTDSALGYLPPASETVEEIQTVTVWLNTNSNFKGGTNNGAGHLNLRLLFLR